MKRLLIAVLMLLSSLGVFAAEAAPIRTYDAWFELPGGTAYSYYIPHNLGYIPIVQPVTGNSTVKHHVFKVTTTYFWVEVRNSVSTHQSGAMKVYLW